MNPGKELAAEFIGTFWLVLGGCGAAVLAAGWGFGDEATPNLGIAFFGVSMAFGLTVVTGAYAVGHISGGHFNPAVSLGLAAGGRFNPAKLPGYIIAQVVGGIAAAAVIYVIASGLEGWEINPAGETNAGAFATNGYDDLSPTGYSLVAALVTEIVLTAMFLIIIMGATAKRAAAGFGGLAIGLGLVLIHLISIPVTNTSVNPARSTSQAIFAGTDYIAQLWLFWLAPIVGAIIGALIYRGLIDSNDDVLEAA